MERSTALHGRGTEPGPGARHCILLQPVRGARQSGLVNCRGFSQLRTLRRAAARRNPLPHPIGALPGVGPSRGANGRDARQWRMSGEGARWLARSRRAHGRTNTKTILRRYLLVPPRRTRTPVQKGAGGQQHGVPAVFLFSFCTFLPCLGGFNFLLAVTGPESQPAYLPSCLPDCVPGCLSACLPSCLLTYLPACLLTYQLACLALSVLLRSNSCRHRECTLRTGEGGVIGARYAPGS